MDSAKDKAVDSSVLTFNELNEMLVQYAENEPVITVIRAAIERRLQPT